MPDTRLKTSLWISAQVRSCDVALIPAVVARRGDSDSGQVLLKRDRRNGVFEVFARTLAPDGGSAWRRAAGPGEEALVDEYIRRESNIDPDLWILEIEDPNDRYVFDSPLV